MNNDNLKKIKIILIVLFTVLVTATVGMLIWLAAILATGDHNDLSTYNMAVIPGFLFFVLLVGSLISYNKLTDTLLIELDSKFLETNEFFQKCAVFKKEANAKKERIGSSLRLITLEKEISFKNKEDKEILKINLSNVKDLIMKKGLFTTDIHIECLKDVNYILKFSISKYQLKNSKNYDKLRTFLKEHKLDITIDDQPKRGRK